MSVIYKCPVCQQPLFHNIEIKTLTCPQGHSYDRAKEGYFNLVLSNEKRSLSPGDTKEMVLSRRLFLNKGYYGNVLEALSSKINELAQTLSRSPKSTLNLLDLGCGEGYYTSGVHQALTAHFNNVNIIGSDISKEAIKSASKQHKACNFIVGNSFFTPFFNESMDLIYSVFSPISEVECARLLVPGGYFVRVLPQTAHLIELRSDIYHDVWQKDYSGFQRNFENIRYMYTELLEYQIGVEALDYDHLMRMTPHGYRQQRQKYNEKGEIMAPKQITVAMQLVVYQKDQMIAQA